MMGSRWVRVAATALVAGLSAFFAATMRAPDAASGAHKPLVVVYCTGKPPKPKPSRCNFRVPDYSSYKVKDLRWERWGSRRTVGRGTSLITHRQVKITLSRRVTCQVGPPYAVKIYTQMTLRQDKQHRFSFEIPDCDGPI
jgi:hypothetical protein